MDLTIHTERLVIRPVQDGDYPVFKAGYDAVGPSRNQFDEGPMDTGFMTPGWFSGLVLRHRAEAERDYSYMLQIFRKSDGAFVGYCDITIQARESFHWGRIGYTIHNPYWGNGYATECVRAITDFAFGPLHLHRLEAHVHPDNAASAHVLEKAGYQFEVLRKAFEFEDGLWQDRMIFLRLNDHWSGTTPDA